MIHIISLIIFGFTVWAWIVFCVAGNYLDENTFNNKQRAAFVLLVGPVGWVILAVIIPVFGVFYGLNWIFKELR